MVAADDGDPTTLAQMHEVKIVWDDPQTRQVRGSRSTTRYFRSRRRPINRGAAKIRICPGAGLCRARRADARFALDAAGELFVYSKTDGMIRAVTAVRDGAVIARIRRGPCPAWAPADERCRAP